MKDKSLNTAQALMAHIALKTETLELFGAQIKVRQWSASQRIKYLALLQSAEGETDPLKLIKPQAQVVALSLVNDAGEPLFPVEKWQGNEPVFEDKTVIESFVQNRPEETAEALMTVSTLNGVIFGKTTVENEDEQAVKN